MTQADFSSIFADHAGVVTYFLGAIGVGLLAGFLGAVVQRLRP